jgi:hypothetical protein
MVWIYAANVCGFEVLLCLRQVVNGIDYPSSRLNLTSRLSAAEDPLPNNSVRRGSLIHALVLIFQSYGTGSLSAFIPNADKKHSMNTTPSASLIHARSFHFREPKLIIWISKLPEGITRFRAL